MDNILVTGKTREKHRSKVRRVLTTLMKVGLRTKQSKYEFEKKKITFLGYCIGRKEICPIKKKLQILKKWKLPTKVKKVQVFFGFVNFYRKFVSKAAERMKSLTQLTKKDKKWKWKKKEQTAFDETRRKLMKERLLRIFDPGKEVTINTDISDHITAGALSQEEQPVEFILHKMNTTEQNYTITEKEMLAVM